MRDSDDRPVLRAWRELAVTDIIYKAIAFALLTPLITVLFRLLVRRSGSTAVADADIALFFFTTKSGSLALILIGGLIIAVIALEQACLMTIVLAALRGAHPRVRDAFAHASKRSFAVLRATAQIVVRVLVIVVPFAAAIGATYWALLSGHDINFYLTNRPPEFLAAVAIAGLIALGLGVVLVRTTLSWLLVLPLVVFENVLPIRAFAESKLRMNGHRKTAASLLVPWAALAVGLPIAVTWALQLIGRAIAPAASGSVAALLVFVGGLAVVWGAASLAVGIAVAAGFALLVVRVYVDEGGAAQVKLPERYRDELTVEGHRWRVSIPPSGRFWSPRSFLPPGLPTF